MRPLYLLDGLSPSTDGIPAFRFNEAHVSPSRTTAEESMTRPLVAEVLLATALVLVAACSSGDGPRNEGGS